MRRRLIFVLDWFGFLLLVILSLPLLYTIAQGFVRAMMLDQ
jgi:hypothetical protein